MDLQRKQMLTCEMDHSELMTMFLYTSSKQFYHMNFRQLHSQYILDIFCSHIKANYNRAKVLHT
jgi:hypothetical protein